MLVELDPHLGFGEHFREEALAGRGPQGGSDAGRCRPARSGQRHRGSPDHRRRGCAAIRDYFQKRKAMLDDPTGNRAMATRPFRIALTAGAACPQYPRLLPYLCIAVNRRLGHFRTHTPIKTAHTLIRKSDYYTFELRGRTLPNSLLHDHAVSRQNFKS